MDIEVKISQNSMKPFIYGLHTSKFAILFKIPQIRSVAYDLLHLKQNRCPNLDYIFTANNYFVLKTNHLEVSRRADLISV